VDDFDRGAWTWEAPSGIAVDAAGDVYVAGPSYDGSGNRLWTIRKGVGGTSFSTVVVVMAGSAYAIFAHPTAASSPLPPRAAPG